MVPARGRNKSLNLLPFRGCGAPEADIGTKENSHAAPDSETGKCKGDYGNNDGKKKRTKRDVSAVPWSVLEAVIAPHYPKEGPQGGRRAFPIVVMLRIYWSAAVVQSV